ncbi:MAG: VWA domain-containing protein [Terriglobales bacterium]
MVKLNYEPVRRAGKVINGRLAVAASASLFIPVLLATLLMTQAAPAQNLPKASNAPTSNSSAEHVPDNSPSNDAAQDEPSTTLKVNVEVVQLFFNVKDKHGALIPNLPKEDFDIFEDGKQQTIKYFKAESDLPLTLGILLDVSGSQLRVLDMEKEVGASFLENILRSKDEAFLISFGTDIELLQDFTNSVSRLRHALNEAKMNAGGVGCSGGPIGPQGPIPCPSTGQRGTALYDAVYLASHDELSHEVGRKAMVLLTDGEDEGSRLKIKDAIEAAQKADTICYVLLIADRGFYGGSLFYSGASEMKKMTQETGGRVIDVGNKPDKLRKAFDEIAAELRSQYDIGYTSSNTTRDGGFRKVEIKSKQGDYKIQARSGYYAAAARGD